MKLLLYTICYIVYPFSFLIIRKKNSYAFGSFRGSFNDNAKYLFIYASEHCKDIKIAWISQNKATVNHIRSMGFKAYYVFSLRGVWHALTSKYWFFNSYTSDIMYCLSGGAVCVNLWHGVGIKRIEYNITTGPLSKRYDRSDREDAYCHPEVFRKPDYIVSSSSFQTEFFSMSFRVPKECCLEFGYSRNEILKQSDSERMAFVKKYESESVLEMIEFLKRFDKVLIYMPTWRDSQRDIFVQGMNLERLNNVLAASNEVVLLKPHANVIIDNSVHGLSNVLILDGRMDVYPLLPYTDVLITDYSSILYDYLLMPDKDVILYLYDYKDYVADRDFAYPFDENVTGKKVFNFEDLLQCVSSHDYAVNSESVRHIVDKFWGKSIEYNSCEKLLDFIDGKKG